MTTRQKALTCVCTIGCAALLLVLALPIHCFAADDDDPPGRVARLSYLRGSISFQPAGAPDWAMAVVNRPMTSGDKLWVDADSRAEVQIGSATIRLNSRTGFSFLNLDDRTVQIQLSAGTLGLTVRHLDRDEVVEVDTSNQAFSVLEPGSYRIYASDDGNTTIVNVREGQGEATGAGRAYTIESQQAITLTGTDSLAADIESTEGRDRDDFDSWCDARDRREAESASRRYLSPEVVGYQDLDNNGVWRYDSEYGELWVPIAIPVGWAPYHFGHWSWISPWGWTWVDDAPWGYATSHYGRWVYTEHTWCWVPGPSSIRPVYAPALVAFVGGPSLSMGVAVDGSPVIAWFPLGPREVYVPAYRVSPAYLNRVNISNASVSTTTVTNVYNATVINTNTMQLTKIASINSSAPNAVTAVARTSFIGGQPVASTAVVVNQRQLAAAHVTVGAEVAPTSTSLVGPAVAGNHRIATPPPTVLSRSVMAKVTPPLPPIPFEQQQAALAQHPGQPLARNEAEGLRSANAPQAQRNQPLAKAPVSVFPSYSEPASEQASSPANAGSTHQQSTTQPIHEQVSYHPAPLENEPTAQPSNSRSGQASPAFPGPPVISPAEPHRNTAAAPPLRTNGDLQPAESKVKTSNPAPGAREGSPPQVDDVDHGKDKNK